jgi:hypothetical protein
VGGRFADITGQVFGRLVAIEQVESDKQGQSRFRCRCDCGQEIIARAANLKNGNSRSCGCLAREAAAQRAGPLAASYKHGHAIPGKETPEYNSHHGAIGRCHNPKNKNFKDWGGRGIRVCDRWRFGENGKSGFECFLEDMGLKPAPHLTLDRFPDYNGNYQPGNCRWATAKQQRDNQRPTSEARVAAGVARRGLKATLTTRARMSVAQAAWVRRKAA